MKILIKKNTMEDNSSYTYRGILPFCRNPLRLRNHTPLLFYSTILSSLFAIYFYYINVIKNLLLCFFICALQVLQTSCLLKWTASIYSDICFSSLQHGHRRRPCFSRWSLCVPMVDIFQMSSFVILTEIKNWVLGHNVGIDPIITSFMVHFLYSLHIMSFWLVFYTNNEVNRSLPKRDTWQDRIKMGLWWVGMMTF